ncbi:MAG: histidinol dehydrogenase [Trueperaceae bacterium]|nr:histidinol dehydrogenase [Trueperaceae bacterium]
MQSVRHILSEIRLKGDVAVRQFTQKFDGALLEDFRVPEAAFEVAESKVDAELKEAIALAAKRVRAFYEHQPKEGFIHQENGSLLGQLVRPLERVACYVPGGQVPLFSTLLMTAVPAQVAGVPDIVVATPANAKGEVAPEILLAAKYIGLSTIYRLGAAVAVGALAFGTASIKRVDKIVGPGNAYTMAAKKLAFGEVGIEALPGPTETLVIADDSADLNHVIADLLAQAEHDAAQPVLVTTSQSLAQAVETGLEASIRALPNPAMALESCMERGYLVVVDSLDEAIEVANAYAAEHLCLLVQDPWKLVPQVKHAGGLFIGENSMEALGDYIIGPSHVMPTSGTARFSSAINVRDFQKVIPLISLNKETVTAIGPAGAKMARAEGLEAHARAIESRLKGD